MELSCARFKVIHNVALTSKEIVRRYLFQFNENLNVCCNEVLKWTENWTLGASVGANKIKIYVVCFLVF